MKDLLQGLIYLALFNPLTLFLLVKLASKKIGTWNE